MIEKLRMGIHPFLGFHLVVRPRRLVRRDAGSDLQCCEGSPDINATLSMHVARSGEADAAANVSTIAAQPLLLANFMDDHMGPLSLGFDVG